MKISIAKLRQSSKIALISVYDKTGIVVFAKRLVKLGFGILASGGTAKKLLEADIPVCDVADLVGGGAILGHKVVTLSREIHAGLLASESERKELDKMNIPWIDLVYVDLYPLKQEIALKTSTRESVIEKTDIGGPTMLRSAAKGRRIVVCDPADREQIIQWLKNGMPDFEKMVDALAAKVEWVVADYCLASARYHSRGAYEGLIGREVLKCKYGENAHQVPAALYTINSNDPLALDKFEIVSGDAPSFNNLNDLNRIMKILRKTAAGHDLNYQKVPFIGVAAKHGNACGAGLDLDHPKKALEKMIDGDRRAIFGGVVMVNFPIDENLAEHLLTYNLQKHEKRRNLDCIAAPAITAEAIEILRRKKDKCRFLVNPALGKLSKKTLDKELDIRPVCGGFLAQPSSAFVLRFDDKQMEKLGRLSKSKEQDLLLAWAIGSCSSSNTITIVKDNMLLGNGVAQQDRVTACQLAVTRAKAMKHDLEDAAAYSDSFFPFVDAPKVLSRAGITTIFASSGSVGDEKVKAFCKEKNINWVSLPDSLCRGFLH